MAMFDPPLTVSRLSDAAPGSIVSWGDKYAFCGALAQDPARYAVIYKPKESVFDHEYGVNPPVLSFPKKDLVVMPDLKSFDAGLSPAREPTSTLFILEGSPRVLVIIGHVPYLLSLDTGILSEWATPTQRVPSGFTRWQIGVRMASGEVTELMKVAPRPKVTVGPLRI